MEKQPLRDEMEDAMPKVSITITQQIFLEFFQSLKDKYHIDEEIVNRLKRLYEENKLSDSTELDKLIEWLEEYNAKDQESKSQMV